VAEIAAATIGTAGATHKLNLAKAKVLPQQARIRYFLAVASRRCDMQQPPEKLSGDQLGNSPQSVHAKARPAMNDRFVSTPEITISRYAGF
jgi:hypothetical protein